VLENLIADMATKAERDGTVVSGSVVKQEAPSAQVSGSVAFLQGFLGKGNE
jgi:hypothetical protein